MEGWKDGIEEQDRHEGCESDAYGRRVGGMVGEWLER